MGYRSWNWLECALLELGIALELFFVLEQSLERSLGSFLGLGRMEQLALRARMGRLGIQWLGIRWLGIRWLGIRRLEPCWLGWMERLGRKPLCLGASRS
jgi:hypothetical protein